MAFAALFSIKISVGISLLRLHWFLLLLNKFVLICDWNFDTDNTSVNVFQDSLIKQYER